MNHLKHILLLLILALPLLASARLGEAITECDARYGNGKPGTCSAEDRIKPLVTGPNTTNLTYLYKGFTVRIGFRESRAVRMDISQSGTSKLSDAKVSEILEGNRGANPWYQTSSSRVLAIIADSGELSRTDKEIKAWRRLDDTIAVLYNRARSMRLVLGGDENKPNPAPAAPAKPGTTPPKPAGGSSTF